MENFTNFDIQNLEDNSRTRNHYKMRMRYHIVFSVKYRKKILEPIRDDVFESFRLSERNAPYRIIKMNTDKDHIHMVVEIPPTMTVGDAVHRLKQTSTYYLWKTHPDYLRTFFWGKKKLVWTHGYFVSTIGMVSENKVLEYIENQGKDTILN